MRRSRVLGPFSARVTALAAAMLLIHAAPVAAQQSATAHLEPLAGSGASGTATLTAQGGGTVASLDVAGLIPGGSYAARLHAGSCAQPSASFTPLGTLVPDATGRASASGRSCSAARTPSRCPP